jgi:hypothetical protein
MYYQGYNTGYSYGSPCCGGGYPAYGGYGGGYGGGFGGGFALILVLFILLVIIIGARPFFGPGPVV